METKVYKVDSKQPQKDIIKEAAAIIKNGGLVAFPTETVYGLGADALLPEGAKRIYAAKGRPSDNPLIVHIADFDALEKIVKKIPEEARLLAEAFWPGPLTMIFEKSDAVPLETTGGLSTVAVRMPVHPVAMELIRESGGYIAAPSANTSGRPSPTLASHVYEDMKGKIPMILDGGPVGIGLESSIIDLSVDPPMILRPGYINRAMMEDVIGQVKDDPGLSENAGDIRPKAPGMKYKHYAPHANMVLVRGETGAVADKINALVSASRSEGKKCGIICCSETEALYHDADVRCAGSIADEDAIAHNLYAILRDFDETDVDCIYSEVFATPRLGRAIMNRMLRAAAHQVIDV